MSTTNQRAVARHIDGDLDAEADCDIGAFEFAGSGATEIPTLGTAAIATFIGLLLLVRWGILGRQP